jgi:5-methylcytosine-specific restriction protein A
VAQAKVADHWPLSFVQLKAKGVIDPHADARLRPLCWSCHSRETGRNQPGGVIAERRTETESERAYRQFVTEREEPPPF